MNALRTAVLISGRGSNLRSLIEASKQPDCPFEITLVIADRECPGLRYARDTQITTATLDFKPKILSEMLDIVLRGNRIELVVLAGFMRILSEPVVNGWQGRMLNIHPSLLPDFPGLHPQQQALEAGVPASGCTVQYVIPEVDAGPIIAQAVVDVFPDDTEQTLSDRILQVENVLYPIVVASVARQLLNDGTDRDRSRNDGIIQQSRDFHGYSLGTAERLGTAQSGLP